ncbi:MAG TPA: LLM class F420-dependent oxidoreductase [Baekduia sp.]|uniref:LLM class F420-dependent oxidoreductase n=1 Tax=Baekduia sp. TaxID=2600305 RepID=UPI002D77F11C|nr:LLM class F420-dependent oxidoreductase [Baekduia sp.]HET6509958.1 LLM class F420-dependent oxidoreductase [Baekduia sp.]
MSLKLGIGIVATDDGVDPVRLAQEAEQLGFESLFLADHTHIPVARATPYPMPPYGDLPREYYRTCDPFVTLAAAATATSVLRLGTGVSLPVERDPILMAKQVATLDHLSGGRVVLGVGAGWNREEMRNHGTDPRTRMALLGERVEAMKAIWTQERAEYHGRFVDFDPIYSWPKPAQAPHPPVLVGGGGPTVLDRVLAFGDGWMPGHQRDLGALGARIDELNARVDAGDGRPRPVSIMLARVEALERYAAMGADRAVFLVDPGEGALREVHALRDRAAATGLAA